MGGNDTRSRSDEQRRRRSGRLTVSDSPRTLRPWLTSHTRAAAVRFDRSRPNSRSIVELIRAGTLDAELAAQLWLLVEARVPIVVAAEAQGVGKSTLLHALLDFLPAGRPRRRAGRRGRDLRLAAAGDRARLAGRRPPDAGGRARSVPGRPSCSPPSCPTTCRPTPGARRRGSPSGPPRSATAWRRRSTPIRSTTCSRRSGEPPVRLTDDELSHLGVVLILRVVDGRPAAGRGRPLRPPDRPRHRTAISSASDRPSWPPGTPTTDAFEHFGWGVTPELALRIGRPAGDFEIEADRRREHLDGARPGRRDRTRRGPGRHPRLPSGPGV